MPRVVTDWSKKQPASAEQQRANLERMARGKGSMAEAAQRILKRTVTRGDD